MRKQQNQSEDFNSKKEKWWYIMATVFGPDWNEKETTNLVWLMLPATGMRSSSVWVRIILTSSLFFNLTTFFPKLFLIWRLFFSKAYFSILIFFLELECWTVANMIFDHETSWISRPNNPRPPLKKDLDRRRRLLHAMGNQFARYLAVIRAESLKIKNNVAKENPIVIDDWRKKPRRHRF